MGFKAASALQCKDGAACQLGSMGINYIFLELKEQTFSASEDDDPGQQLRPWPRHRLEPSVTLAPRPRAFPPPPLTRSPKPCSRLTHMLLLVSMLTGDFVQFIGEGLSIVFGNK
jgi:hypothetical protein